MPFYTDQLHRTIDLPNPPRRIVSLVPSQTELLYDLGLEKEVVGITKFCVHPEKWFRNKQRIGGTKNVDLKKIASLQPDLIIANKEENVKEQVKELAKDFPVWISDVNTLTEALGMIKSIGTITGQTELANRIKANIQEGFAERQIPNCKLQAAYLIWKDPYMTIGGDTFIHDLLKRVGLNNVFEDRLRYPTLSLSELRSSDCQLVLLSSEPFPFRQKHIDELARQLPGKKIVLVDGEMFSWYGSRLLQVPAYFNQLQKEFFS